MHFAKLHTLHFCFFLQPPSAVNELSTSSSSRVSGFSRFNRDEYNLRRKQVKINSILKMTGSHLEEIENVTEDDVQEDKKLKEDLILKEDEEKREKRSYAPIGNSLHDSFVH